jgi:hypothetical protein
MVHTYVHVGVHPYLERRGGRDEHGLLHHHHLLLGRVPGRRRLLVPQSGPRRKEAQVDKGVDQDHEAAEDGDGQELVEVVEGVELEDGRVVEPVVELVDDERLVRPAGVGDLLCRVVCWCR